MSATIPSRRVLYDGDCGLCSRTMRVLRALDIRKKTVQTDILRDWEPVHEQFPQLDFDSCLRDMHVIDRQGRIFVGFDAYRSLAWVLPLAWPVIPILYLPPVRWCGMKIYRYVADHRHSSCKIAR